jgi:hypothetical protein
MRKLNVLLPTVAAAVLAFGAATTASSAQVSFGVNVGAAPVCPYGYYDYSPYQCAPYGYYGPEWFSNGVFIGAGPWFHGHDGFHGHVDNHFDPNHGYHGAYPARGEHFQAHDNFRNFHGNEMRDGHGTGGHDAGHDGGHH